jgi:hypothetical protein
LTHKPFKINWLRLIWDSGGGNRAALVMDPLQLASSKTLKLKTYRKALNINALKYSNENEFYR